MSELLLNQIKLIQMIEDLKSLNIRKVRKTATWALGANFFPRQNHPFFYHLLKNIYWGKYCVHCSISLVLLLYKYCITLFPISSAVCEFITAHST